MKSRLPTIKHIRGAKILASPEPRPPHVLAGLIHSNHISSLFMLVSLYSKLNVYVQDVILCDWKPENQGNISSILILQYPQIY